MLMMLLALACSQEGPDQPPPVLEDQTPELPPADVPEPALDEVKEGCGFYVEDPVVQQAFQLVSAVDAGSCTFGGAQAKAHQARLRFQHDGTWMRVALRPTACHDDGVALSNGWTLTQEGPWEQCPGLLDAVTQVLDSSELPAPTEAETPSLPAELPPKIPVDFQEPAPPEVPAE